MNGEINAGNFEAAYKSNSKRDLNSDTGKAKVLPIKTAGRANFYIKEGGGKIKYIRTGFGIKKLGQSRQGS